MITPSTGPGEIKMVSLKNQQRHWLAGMWHVAPKEIKDIFRYIIDFEMIIYPYIKVFSGNKKNYNLILNK